MDEYISDLLAEIGSFYDLELVPFPVPFPLDPAESEWIDLLKVAKDEFEVDGAIAAFSLWRVESDITLNSMMTEERASKILSFLSEVGHLLRVKFTRLAPKTSLELNEWSIEDKFDPVREGKTRNREIVTISRDTRPGALVGIDSLYYQNAYPVTAVVYGLYPLRDPNPENLVPLKDGDLNCVAQRVVEHFDGALRG